jgi:DNA primase
MLAQRAGVELKPPSPQAAAAEQRLNLLGEINQAAANYFHHLLLNSDEAARARSYLDERGLNRETIDSFRVGYALDSWDGLLNYLVSKGYALADAAEVGVVIEREDKSGFYDRFRGRVVFSIRDHRGRTVGFGGRVLGDDVPKYVNSPQSPLFDKSSTLFGLDQAKQGIRIAGEAVIVEGYMDVLMAHQHGLSNVVAQMGTALTEAQLRLLKRYTQRFILALDSDVAGDQATLRGLDVVQQVADRTVVPVPTPRGLIRFEERLAAEIRIATLPPGYDPDEVIREDESRWTRLIEQAKPVMDYYFQALTADLDLTEARGKTEAVRALGPLVAGMGDRVQRAHYLQQLARMVQVDERALWDQIRQMGGPRQLTRRPQPERSAEQTTRDRLRLDEHCLSLILSHPHLLSHADEALRAAGDGDVDAEDFATAEDRAVLSAWRQWLTTGGSPDARGAFYDTLDESLQGRVEALLRAGEAQPAVPEGRLQDDFLDAVTRLRLRNLQRQVQELRFLMEEGQDGEAGAIYGPLITQAAMRMRRLQKAMNERSVAARRRGEDSVIRVPLAAE